MPSPTDVWMRQHSIETMNAITNVLLGLLGDRTGNVIEIGSGTGQHVDHLCGCFAASDLVAVGPGSFSSGQH